MQKFSSLIAPYDYVRKMRASYYVLGPVLAREGHVELSLPGGCAIGARPMDIHLSSLEQMGATIEIKNGYVHADIKGRLKGAHITFHTASVGATCNILMAATLAEGETVIENAAKEPEIGDLIDLLTAMGAKIEGRDSSKLTIQGVDASFVAIAKNGGVNISARSMGALNVQVILEPLGGGGHLTMAGAQLRDCTVKEAEARIRAQIDEYRANQECQEELVGAV